MHEHTCRCVECDPALVSAGERVSEAHMAVRFGDDAMVREQGLRVYLDGEDVTDHTFESIAGVAGVIWQFVLDANGSVHRCLRCWQGACATIRTGRVEVRRPLEREIA